MRIQIEHLQFGNSDGFLCHYFHTPPLSAMTAQWALPMAAALLLLCAGVTSGHGAGAWLGGRGNIIIPSVAPRPLFNTQP